MSSIKSTGQRIILWATIIVVSALGLIRYLQQPTFWLDEAFIAVSLKTFELQKIFAPLEYAQFFPRLYLSAIGLLRDTFGYHIWDLRLLPFFCFVVATILWASLIAKRATISNVVVLLGMSLLLGSRFWLDQAIQLKQYTFDVSLALIPFFINDSTFKESFSEGRSNIRLALLAIPCAFSYTYPFALFARVLGWYLFKSKHADLKVKPTAVIVFVSSVVMCLLMIWLTDHQYNLQDKQAYYAYWSDCILRLRFQEGAISVGRLFAKFLWGWHGRMPIVTAVIVPLQIVGIISIIRQWQRPMVDSDSPGWGSRSLGSIILLGSIMLASIIINYPMCAGRVTLFSQIHTQIIALEGALFLIVKYAKKGLIVVSAMAAIVFLHSGREYIRVLNSEPAENLNSVIPLIDPQIANKVVVSTCSVAQVRSLPEILPAQEVIFGFKAKQLKGERVWVLWSHLGADYCQEELEQFRSKALIWQVVKEKTDVGLVIAEFEP